MPSITLAFSHEVTNYEKTIQDFPAVLGRSDHCTVALHSLGDSCMSRSHARLHWKNGRCWIEDADSLLGTFLNGRKLEFHSLHAIAPGDEIFLGQTTAFVRLPPDAPAAAAGDGDLGSATPHHVFLSHSTPDKPLVERNAADLARLGIDSFLANNDIEPG